MTRPVSGFSRKTKEEKIQWLAEHYLSNDLESVSVLERYWNDNKELQRLHDDFIENTLSNFYLPFAIAPNFLINEKLYALPMVIEESSVVAASSNSAKFWLDRGGFKSKVISTIKNGQIHIKFFGKDHDLIEFFSSVKKTLINAVSTIETNMKKRGGGIKDIELINSTEVLEGYYQLHCTFDTLNAMGANFINSCLEKIAKTFESLATGNSVFKEHHRYPEVIMSILSNYSPECLVRAEVKCKVDQLTTNEIDGNQFAEKFVSAIEIAKVDTRRAVTHNKGIMNGIDAMIIATGNDFRAVEAGVHAFAAKDGKYTSITDAKVDNGMFSFWIEIPLALGTVGGITSLHPLVKVAHDLLQKPDAKELMQLVAVAGLAQNFAAIRSLITTGIQKGHMKMHLMNILNQLKTNDNEKEQAIQYFKDRTISHRAVINFVEHLRR